MSDSQRLLDHFAHPRNAGELENPSVVVEVSNPACGDILRLSARLAGGRVEAIRFQVRGCAASIAAGSALTEWILGRDAAGLGGLRAQDIEDALGGLEPASQHAAALAVEGARALARAVARQQP